MTVTQVYTLVNNATSEAIGSSALLKDDLQNVVDIGTALFNASAVDKYVGSLVNHIGKVIFVNRAYSGNVPSVLMDGWEYGSVLEKISVDLPAATANASWSLTSGTSYDPNVFSGPTVNPKFYNSKVTFEIALSITELQVKQSFSSAEQLNGFVSMLYNEIDKSMTIKIDELVMKTIDNMIGETFYAEVPGGTYTGRSGNKCINLLYLYNQQFGTSLTADDALTSPDFLKFASYKIGLYADRLAKASTLFNAGGKVRFTPADKRHLVLLSEFAKAIGPYSLAPAYNEQYLKLPDADTVPFWQGSGTGYSFGDTGKVYITTASNHDVTITGILGVMFDHDALGVCNQDRRVTTNYNPKAEFYNNWFKFDCSYFNDTNENFVVFYVA